MKPEDKSVFTETIGYAPGFLVLNLTVLLASMWYESPSLLVPMVGIPFGLIVAFALPYFWRRNYDWLSSLVVVLPAIIVSTLTGESFNGLQAVFLAMTIVSLVWCLLKSRLIAYVEQSGG